MRKIAAVITSVLVIAILTIGAGCNTLHGLGKDIETGGKAIEKATGK